MADNNNEKSEGTSETNNLTIEDWKQKEDVMRRGFAEQATQLKSENQSLQEQIDAIKGEHEKQEAARLKEQDEYKTLYEKLTEKLTTKENEWKAELDQREQQLQELEQDSVLNKAGISGELAQLGLKTKYSMLEEPPQFADWVETLREKSPELFEEKSRVTSKNSAAGVAQKHTTLSSEQIDRLLASDDPEDNEKGIAAAAKEIGLTKFAKL